VKKFYVCALLGVLIKCFYEMYGATMRIVVCRYISRKLRKSSLYFYVLA